MRHIPRPSPTTLVDEVVVVDRFLPDTTLSALAGQIHNTLDLWNPRRRVLSLWEMYFLRGMMAATPNVSFN